MSDIALVLDTDAMLAFAKHSSQVSREITRAFDQQLEVMLPALCLADAYRRAESDSWFYLEVLTNHPATVVGPVDVELCPFLGGWSRTLGRMDLAHAALEAATHRRATVITSERKRMSEILPNEGRIVDL